MCKAIEIQNAVFVLFSSGEVVVARFIAQHAEYIKGKVF